MKRVISCLLVCFLLLGCFPLSAFAGAECNCDNIPIVYVIGRTSITADVDKPYEDITPYSDEEVIKGTLEAVAPSLIKGITLGLWDDYYETVTATLIDYLGRQALDNNGNVRDNSGNNSKPDTVTAQHNWDTYFTYRYDYRLSPLENADGLRDYIDLVRETTGHKKVSLIGRCIGANELLAYLVKYAKADNYAGIHSVTMYDPACNGLSSADALFSGEMRLDADGADRFCQYEFSDETSLLYNFLRETVTYLNKSGMLSVTLTIASPLILNIAKNIIPGILRGTYGTMPGYWSMLSADLYEKAKEYVFGGYEEEFAGLLEKTDAYYEQIQTKTYEILEDLKANGVHVNIIAKYGFPVMPFLEDQTAQSNLTILTTKQSFGANCAPVDGELSDTTIAFLTERRLDKYISPDNQIDATTCLFPDSTWFIKNLPHNPFPSSVDPLLKLLSRSKEQMTVWDNENYSQYLLFTPYEQGNYYSGTLSVLTDENCDTVTYSEDGLFASFRKFINALIAYLKSLFNKTQEQTQA